MRLGKVACMYQCLAIIHNVRTQASVNRLGRWDHLRLGQYFLPVRSGIIVNIFEIKSPHLSIQCHECFVRSGFSRNPFYRFVFKISQSFIIFVSELIWILVLCITLYCLIGGTFFFFFCLLVILAFPLQFFQIERQISFFFFFF